MARRRHSNRRRRRGGSGFLYKLLSVLVICAVVIGAMTFFFRVDEVVITGNQRYTVEDVRAAAGVEIGDNLFLLNRSQVAQRIGENLPYVEASRINPKAPDTLIIEVKECLHPLAVVQDGIAWMVNGNGKIVDQLDAAEAENYGIIDGITLLAPSVGTRVSIATEFASRMDSLEALMDALTGQKMMEQVNAIHLGDPAVVTVEYAGRFSVLLPWGADFSLKMRSLQAILDSGKIQDNMTGTFDMRRDDGKVNFIPGRH